MAEVTTGGIAIKVLTNRTAGGLQAYRDAQADDQAEPYLYSATRHCSRDLKMQIIDWKATRVRYGTDGARRRVNARYEACDETGHHASGEYGTHVEYRDATSRRKRKRPVRDGETPTHVRIEPDRLTIKQSEATHTIYAAGADLVNPEDPEQCERFFEAVLAFNREERPGLQQSLWCERNGKSGLLHVHEASNATVFAGFAFDGAAYSAGQKMAGALTDVHRVRDRFNRFLAAHPEYGFSQALAPVGSEEYAKAQLRSGQRSYWDRTRGEESSHDRIRRLVREKLPRCPTSTSGFIASMPAAGVEVKEVGLRRGRPTRTHDLSYRLLKADGAGPWVRGKTLGDDFTLDAIGRKLDRLARGEDVEWTVQQAAGPARALPFQERPLTREQQDEFDELVTSVGAMAAAERTLADSGREAPDPVELSPPERERVEELKKEMAARGAFDVALAWHARPEPDDFAHLGIPPTAEQLRARETYDAEQRIYDIAASEFGAGPRETGCNAEDAPAAPDHGTPMTGPPDRADEVRVEPDPVRPECRLDSPGVADMGAGEHLHQPIDSGDEGDRRETGVEAGARRSRLRDVRVRSPRTRAKLDEAAAWEEEVAGPALERGERLDEQQVAALAFFGPANLERYGRFLLPEVREQMALRLAKRTAHSAAFEARTEAAQRHEALVRAHGAEGAAAKAASDEWIGHDQRVRMLERELRGGVYEETAEVGWLDRYVTEAAQRRERIARDATKPAPAPGHTTARRARRVPLPVFDGPAEDEMELG